MDTILIFIASLGTVYFVARRTGSGQFTLADFMIGVFAGCASLGMSKFLSVEGAEWRSGLPLFFACALAFGLEALPRHSSLR